MIAPRKLTVAVLLHVAALKAGTDVWFAPLDPAPRPGVNYTGPPDFAGLFDSQTPWEKAASRIQVFSVHTRWVLAASESDLRKMIDGLADRKIALAVFADAFAGAAACGQGVGGFGAELPLASTLGAVRRLKSFGAALEYITLNQPIYTGTMYQGSNACRWTPEVMAANAATRVREIRGEFPYVGIGVMEPLPAPGPVEWKDSYAAGIEALQTAFGFALAFFQVNVDWNRTDAMSAVETASRSLAKEFGMPLGVIYSGAATDVSDTSWLSNAEGRLQRLELEKGLIPDQVVFQSTHAYPTKLLPETDPTSFTGWLNRYFRARTVLTAAVNLPAIRGVLLSSDGEPVPDAPITVSAVSMEGLGLSKTYRATGKVPEGANRILFGIRVNLECIDCGGVANVSVSSFRYSDERQSSPIERNFAAGMLGWANSSPASGRNSTSLTKAELRIAASPDQQVHINGSEIPIAAGTNFEFTAVARMGPGTGNSGYLCVIFLGQAESGSKEIARATIPFQPPSPVESGTTTTSAAGAWSTPLLRSADRIGLTASFPGSDTHWPARSTVVWQDESLKPAIETAREYTVSTLAGASAAFLVGDAATFVSKPKGVAFDRSGNLYLTGANCVFKLDPLGKVTRVAGNYIAGFSGDGGLALSASLNNPSSVAFDSAGNLYIADYSNFRIRRVSPDGRISTFAGTGSSTPSGDGGPAAQAAIVPASLAFDSAGNLFVGGYFLVRKITPAGTISTHATLLFVTAVAVDTKDNLYVADLTQGVSRFAAGATTRVRIAGGGRSSPGDGGWATDASFYANGLAVDPLGNVFISEQWHRIRKVIPSGIISTVAGDGVGGNSGDGGDALKARIDGPQGLAADASGNIFFADSNNMRLRKISGATGLISAVLGAPNRELGDRGPAAKAALFEPVGLALDPDEQLYVADSGNHRVRRIDSDGIVTTVAGTGTAFLSGDGGPATQAQLNNPRAVAFDAAGSLLIGDSGNLRVRKVLRNGTISSISATATYNVSSLSAHRNGTVYGAKGDLNLVRIGADESVSLLSVPWGERFSCDGREFVTGIALTAVTSTPLGGFFGFSQSSLLDMSLLQRVPAPGTWVTRIGGGSPCNYSVCGFSGDNGPLLDARFCRPKGIAADAYGNLYIADTGNHRIRKVFRDGTVITIAGTGVQGSTGDGGRALEGQIVNPQGIVVNSLGTVYFADGSNRIRVLTPVRGDDPAFTP